MMQFEDYVNTAAIAGTIIPDWKEPVSDLKEEE